jgi:hypothetical protein
MMHCEASQQTDVRKSCGSQLTLGDFRMGLKSLALLRIKCCPEV